MTCNLYAAARRFLSKHYDERTASEEERGLMNAVGSCNSNDDDVEGSE